MATEKQEFMKRVTILCDTREQKNEHIIKSLNTMNVNHYNKKLDFGDYSFILDGKDFSLSCVIERKGSINELWGNITKDRARFEKELIAGHSIAKSISLLIENCVDWNSLKAYTVSPVEMALQNRKVSNIGEYVHNTLKSWASANRYGFDVCFAGNNTDSAAVILSVFYWYWHNYKEILKPIKR